MENWLVLFEPQGNKPFQCILKKKASWKGRKAFLASIDPRIGVEIGVIDFQTDVALMARFEGDNIELLRPIHVHILAVPPLDTDSKIKAEKLVSLAWAILFGSREDAEVYIGKNPIPQ